MIRAEAASTPSNVASQGLVTGGVPTRTKVTKLTGWGRYPAVETELITPRSQEAIQHITAHARGAVARGNGRSYGDAGIGAEQTLWMGAFDRILSFDATTGLVTAEAGVLLSDLIEKSLPRGYFPPVVPGTMHITVGGAIAADVHGKNHHRDGGFSRYVESLVLAADGSLIRTSRSENPELFAATVGGMGLTGIIIEATLRLRPVETGWINQRTVVAPDLDAAITALDAGDSCTYSAAWIDCLARGRRLGRSLIFLGEHARIDELTGKAAESRFPVTGAARLGAPFDFPDFCLNRWSVRAFNELYFRNGARKAGAPSLVPLRSFFFPLDRVGSWNRIYGRSGFVQHQCIVPLDLARTVLPELLGRIANRGDASFLAVLKKLGPSDGVLSFPFPGYTLALDFPMRPGLLAFLDELDEIVVSAGGRLYLAKDARQSRAVFEAGYPGLGRFRDIKRSIDPGGRLRSHLGDRLGI